MPRYYAVHQPELALHAIATAYGVQTSKIEQLRLPRNALLRVFSFSPQALLGAYSSCMSSASSGFA
jgi:hypothetical protein